ncbi:Rieske [2Fe-2S] domain-containing protein [Porphyromonadaceae bacterium KH3R12]|nr:Rieske [2Fe-2S] domain-containing protein [Porphyromonadaceae bacterium KH3R12]
MRRMVFVLSVIILLAFSCGDETARQTVPYAPVNFRVDPSGYDAILNNPHSYKIFTEEERRLPSDRFGYAGVLVVSDARGGLHAFDLCCPHEDSKGITVTPDYEENEGYNGKVKCVLCGSVFVTMFGLGSVESGPSTEPLQRYNVLPLQDGSYRVVN